MKNITVFILLFISVLIITGCGENTANQEKLHGSVVTEEEKESSSSTDQELDAMFVEKSIEVSFVDVNGDKYDEQSFFKLTGKVNAIGKDNLETLQEFTLTTDEEDGHGLYKIQSIPPTIDSEMVVKEGEIITVYGKYQGREESTSLPIVFIQVIER